VVKLKALNCFQFLKNLRLTALTETFDVWVSQPEAVEAYLTSYPELIPLLEKMLPAARQFFTSAAELELYIYQCEGDRYLCLCSRYWIYPKGMFKLTSKFSRLFLDTFDWASTNGHLHVDSDLQSPRRAKSKQELA